MNINEQVGKLLEELGVEMDHPTYYHAQDNEDALPEISIFQSSREHYGVFYRLDIIEQVPQLRVIVPIDNGLLKMEVYLVTLSTRMPFSLGGLAGYSGSAAFERGREAALQHMLYAIAEIMKQLFWSGDLESMVFPPEIDVQRLL
jgi:hypothetical protein